MSASRGRLRRVVGAYEVSFEVASVESPPGGGNATLSGGTSPCDDRSGRALRRVTAFREDRLVASIADHDSAKACRAWLFDCLAKSFQKSL